MCVCVCVCTCVLTRGGGGEIILKVVVDHIDKCFSHGVEVLLLVQEMRAGLGKDDLCVCVCVCVCECT